MANLSSRPATFVGVAFFYKQYTRFWNQYHPVKKRLLWNPHQRNPRKLITKLLCRYCNGYMHNNTIVFVGVACSICKTNRSMVALKLVLGFWGNRSIRIWAHQQGSQSMEYQTQQIHISKENFLKIHRLATLGLHCCLYPWGFVCHVL